MSAQKFLTVLLVPFVISCSDGPSEAEVKSNLLQVTPLGLSIDESLARVKRDLERLEGPTYYDRPCRSEDSKSSFDVILEQHGFWLFTTDIWARWCFDKSQVLIDIEVTKNVDSM